MIPLLIIILVVLLLRRFGPLLLAWYVKRKLRKMFGPEVMGEPVRDDREQAPAGWTAPSRRRKKIEADQGEYVKFKDLPADPSAPRSEQTVTAYTEEQQIVDAEWEEINP